MYEYFCPFCGEITQISSKQTCCSCRKKMIPVKMEHDAEYYDNLARENCGGKCSELALYAISLKMKEKEIRQYLDSNGGEYAEMPQIVYQQAPARNVPKCPVCQSTNLKKISGLSRAAHAYAFGIFSNTARSQFQCVNCGYKF